MEDQNLIVFSVNLPFAHWQSGILVAFAHFYQGVNIAFDSRFNKDRNLFFQVIISQSCILSNRTTC